MRIAAAWGTLAFAALLGGCTTPPPAPSRPTVARIYLEVRPGESGVAIELPRSGATITVGARPVFAESDIVNAEVVQVDLGRCLLLQFSSMASRDLYRMSVLAGGRRLAVACDGEFLGARRLDEAISDGNLLVFLEIPDDRLPVLVAKLKHTATEIALLGRKAREK